MQPPDGLPLSLPRRLEVEPEQDPAVQRGVEAVRPVRSHHDDVLRPLDLLEEHVGQVVVVMGLGSRAPRRQERVDLIQQQDRLVVAPELRADLLLPFTDPARPEVRPG